MMYVTRKSFFLFTWSMFSFQNLLHHFFLSCLMCCSPFHLYQEIIPQFRQVVAYKLAKSDINEEDFEGLQEDVSTKKRKKRPQFCVGSKYFKLLLSQTVSCVENTSPRLVPKLGDYQEHFSKCSFSLQYHYSLCINAQAYRSEQNAADAQPYKHLLLFCMNAVEFFFQRK